MVALYEMTKQDKALKAEVTRCAPECDQLLSVAMFGLHALYSTILHFSLLKATLSLIPTHKFVFVVSQSRTFMLMSLCDGFLMYITQVSF